jgi:hypothetical protein
VAGLVSRPGIVPSLPGWLASGGLVFSGTYLHGAPALPAFPGAGSRCLSLFSPGIMGSFTES